jgi:hypothetical protein
VFCEITSLPDEVGPFRIRCDGGQNLIPFQTDYLHLNLSFDCLILRGPPREAEFAEGGEGLENCVDETVAPAEGALGVSSAGQINDGFGHSEDLDTPGMVLLSMAGRGRRCGHTYSSLVNVVAASPHCLDRQHCSLNCYSP